MKNVTLERKSGKNIIRYLISMETSLSNNGYKVKKKDLKPKQIQEINYGY